MLFRQPIGLGVFLGEVDRQRQDVGRTLAKRRQAQVDDVEAEVKVLAEPAGARLLLQLAVGRGEHADIDFDRMAAADPVDLPLLYGAQQLGLETDIHLADFVQQQGAAVGFLELSDPPGDGAGEGAFLMAEQFAFQQMFRDRGAVDRDEHLVGPPAFAVDVAGHQLLAGAVLPGDQDGSVAGRYLVGHPQHRTHGGIAADDGMAFLHDRLQHGGDQLGIGWQRDVFLGAGADGRAPRPGHPCRCRRRSRVS